LKNANNNFKIQMRKLDIREDKQYVDDTAAAREKNAENSKVFWLGIVILLTFTFASAAALYGCYMLLTGGITAVDVGVVAAVANFIGLLFGYIAANAQQVISFFYGSSKGSKQKTDAMSTAFKNLKQ